MIVLRESGRTEVHHSEGKWGGVTGSLGNAQTIEPHCVDRSRNLDLTGQTPACLKQGGLRVALGIERLRIHGAGRRTRAAQRIGSVERGVVAAKLDPGALPDGISFGLLQDHDGVVGLAVQPLTNYHVVKRRNSDHGQNGRDGHRDDELDQGKSPLPS